jgi:hypothetical protein
MTLVIAIARSPLQGVDFIGMRPIRDHYLRGGASRHSLQEQ